MTVRLEAGGIVAVVMVDGRQLPVRLERCPAGWRASFEVTTAAGGECAVVHRLVAPTLSEAKAAVPAAVAYLTGSPVDAPLHTD